MRALVVSFAWLHLLHFTAAQLISDGTDFVNQFPYDKIYQFVPSDAELNGNLKIKGSINLAPTVKDAWLKNSKFRSKVSNGRIGPSFGGISLWSHFPWDNQNTYIRPGDVDRDIIIGDIGTNRIFFGSPTTNVNINSNVTISGGISALNPNYWVTTFKSSTDGKNYIRGDTQVTGDLSLVGSLAVGVAVTDTTAWTLTNIFRTRPASGQSGATFLGNKYASHFPWEDSNTYIRPGDDNKDIIIGDIGAKTIRIGSTTTGINFNGQLGLSGGKSAANPNNWDTIFNYLPNGMNFIRGDTELSGYMELRGNLNFDNSARICVGAKCYDISKLAAALDKY